MSLRKSVILALGVIIVLAVAGGLIAYNFRSAMFDRKAAETVPAEGETGIESPAASEDANTVESSSDNITASESNEEIAEEEPAPILPAIEGNETETEEELHAIEETVSEPPVIIPPVQEAAAPAEEAVIDTADTEEAASDALTKEYDILGYTLSARVEDGTVTLSYPDWVKADDAEAFFIHEDDEYGLSEKGMGYTIPAAGTAVIILPEAMDLDEAEADLDILADDLIAYISADNAAESNQETIIPVAIPEPEQIAATTAEAEEIILPIIEESIVSSNPAIEEETPDSEEESPFEFTLFLKGGMLMDFRGVPLPQFGIGLDFKNIIPLGETAGLGLRSDITIELMPTIVNSISMAGGSISITPIPACPVLGSFDLKLMLNADLGLADIFFGGGVGVAAGSADNYARTSSFLGYGPYGIAGMDFRADWFASAIAGVRFNLTELFSIGAEAGYRYIIGTGKHAMSAAIAFGFSF